jgi:hypothetical protein
VATAETLFGWKALSEVERHAAQVVAMRESGIEGPAVNAELLMTSPEQLKAMGLRNGGDRELEGSAQGR